MTDITIPKEKTTYTLDQLKEVWYLGMMSGATVLKVCQDNTSDELSSFTKVTDELRGIVTSEQSIKDISSSSLMLLGIICEILDIKELH